MAKRRKAQATPKGEATKSLEHAKAALRDLEKIRSPNETEAFVNRLNDFLRALRAVPEFLGKEPRGSPSRVFSSRQRKRVLFMQDWIDTYLLGISPPERDRYWYAIGLRDVSTHALMVKPDRGDISVEVFDTRTRGGTILGNLAYQHDYGCAGAENAIQSSKISIKYFFIEQPLDDVVGLCIKVLQTMEAMVAAAYAANP